MIFEGLGVQKSPIRPAGQDYEFKSLLDLHKRVGLVAVYKCVVLWRAVCHDSATERPLGTICEEKGISSRLQVSI